MKRVKYQSGGVPGTTNWRAVAKVAVVIVWLVVPALVDRPLFPLNYAHEYVQDVRGFAQNNSTWWALSESGRWFYVLFPIPWLVCGAAWYEIWFRTRRKRLVINGHVEGVVMLVVGDPAHKEGHLYDLATMLNGFKHIAMKDFPRPITGKNHPPGVTVYYRRTWLSNPLTWPKIATRVNNMEWGFHTLWLDGHYRTRVRHDRRPVLDYELLTDAPPYTTEDLEYMEFVKDHRNTQETIMKDNYRMTVSEPGTAKSLVRSSMMTIGGETKNEYLDQLPVEERNRIIAKAIEEGGDHVWPAQVGQ